MSDIYQVVKKEEWAQIDGKQFDFMVEKYYVTPYGREPVLDGNIADPFVEVWADGSMTLHNNGDVIFLYGGQWNGIITALSNAIDDKKRKRDAKKQEWLISTADSKIYYGIAVSLSRTETINALLSCEIKIEKEMHSSRFGNTSPMIIFGGSLYSLCRTDLKDNVSTGLCANKTAEEWREHYLNKAKECCGARLQDYDDGRKEFCIIDALSDG